MSTATPTSHVDLCTKLARHITSEDLAKLKDTVKADEFGSFKAGELEEIKRFSHLFERLEIKKIIRVGDYENLKKIFKSNEMIKVIDVINETERALQEEGKSKGTLT